MLPYDRMALRCPVCLDPLHITMDYNSGGMRLWCRKAIGESSWDRTWQRSYFPPEAMHLKAEYSVSDPQIACQVKAWEAGQEERADRLERLRAGQAA